MGYERRLVAVVCFGDIRGFTPWEMGLTAPDLEFPPFMNKFEGMIAEFKKRTGYHVKTLGDAYMAVLEVGTTPTIEFLKENYVFAGQLRKMISQHPWPRPDGFRIRATSGHLWKKVCRGQIDYVGRHANKAHKLLGFDAERLFVCDQAVKELVTSSDLKRHKFRFIPIKPDRRVPDGLTKHDMKSLYELEKRR